MQRNIFKAKTKNGDWREGTMVYENGMPFLHVYSKLEKGDYELLGVDEKTISQIIQIEIDAEGYVELYENGIYFEEIEFEDGDRRIYYIFTWIKEWCMFSMLSQNEYLDYMHNGIGELEKESDRQLFIFETEHVLKYHYCGNINDDNIYTIIKKEEL